MAERNSCCGKSDCCVPQGTPPQRRSVDIQFLYLDLETCSRCQGTETVLAEALAEVARVLDSAGYDVRLTKIKVETEQQATSLRLVSSPTIRVNSHDIQVDVRESVCGPCSDISGDATDCRVWVYQGVEYDVPPKAVIVEAVLREVFSPEENRSTGLPAEFALPHNLKRFFESRRATCGADRCCGSAGRSGAATRTRCC
ncbi:MAG: DUF2703 domain-containing protein [Bacillota bacterium]|nr:DUF2703 domain-containing protein [Bacillota bacterium]